MTYFWTFKLTSILTSIYEVRHLKVDLQRSGISFLTTVWIPWPQLPIKRHPTWHTLEFLSVLHFDLHKEVIYSKIDLQRSWQTKFYTNLVSWTPITYKKDPKYDIYMSFLSDLHFDLHLWGQTHHNWSPEIRNIIFDYSFGFPSPNYLYKDNPHDIYSSFLSGLHFDLHLWGHTPQNWPPEIPNIIID